MKKRNTIMLCATFVMAMASCSGADSKSDSASQPLTEEQIQQVVEEGRMAARAMINVDDTLAIQSKLLEARARQSKYVTKGQKVQAEVFDTAFVRTLRAVRPDLAREVELAGH